MEPACGPALLSATPADAFSAALKQRITGARGEGLRTQRQGGTAMRTTRIGALGSILAVALVTAGGVAFAGNNPVDEKWWPSEFGPDDQTGATQYITPEKRLAAVKLVKQGKVQTLGMPYSNHMPLVPGPHVCSEHSRWTYPRPAQLAW
jgi:hypothetical protein